MTDSGQTNTVKRPDRAQLRELAREAAQMAAPAYAAVGWAWADGVPDQVRIEARLCELIRDVPLDHTQGTGGLSVTRWIEDGEERFAVSLDLGGTGR